MKKVKLALNPSAPNIEAVENFVMTVGGEYSSESVIIQLFPNIQDYKAKDDQPGIEVRQVMVTTSTADTQTLEFNFTDKNQHIVAVDGENYTIKLDKIGEESIPGFGDGFKYFEFTVSQN
ncbi:hypothetical protein JAO76_15625 [Pontibacter sp. BT310]|uniref:Uncharacterized protein n=1 Tax=Pontibacter populi TaxID=890055 RepID=A0ABS6XET3_9BACT|nr:MULTISPECIES: hypothetical protein [Pontibacter]MBJ6119640.1 hypothetical protein [Pontibacter sp. BT310]MBR0572067.1 hypothetical protein [Microvirga sp. STS03]MBW3366493.1 hypothetical protein [Pontibacter populi]